MSDLLLALLALVWLAGICLRIYRQARFYQIEEYMSARYLRWLMSQRSRWLPLRPAIAGVVGSALLILLADSAPVIQFALALITVLAAIWPPPEGEIKKGFRATPRARRMLAAAFAAAGMIMILALLISGRSAVVDLRAAVLTALGLIAFLLAPLLLIVGNLLMTPVEALGRRRFIARARGVLAEVNPVIIGITGSYGKTSTKNYLAHILNGRYHAYPTPKSYNTLMGICIAINNELAHDHSVDYFIAEMGAYIPGEIERICALTRPTISIVIEVGPQHLERFGSLENVAIAKYEIVKALPEDGLGIFNWDNEYVRAMYQRGYPSNRIAVSQTVDLANAPPDGPRLIASNVVESLDGLTFTLTDRQTGDQAEIVTPLLGGHNVTNLLLAAAVALHEGMPLRDVARRMRTLQPAESRLVRQSTGDGITIINDAYSTNPVGAAYALRVLGMHTSGRRLLITPGMVELGPLMEGENRRLGELAAAQATDVILVGARQTEPIKVGLLAAGFPPERLLTVETLAEAVQWYQNQLAAGDAVLFLNDLPDTYSA